MSQQKYQNLRKQQSNREFQTLASRNWQALVVFLGMNLLLGFSAEFALAYDPKDRPMLANETPKELQDVGITEKLSTNIDTNLTFTDETGQQVTLAKYLNGQRPVLLSIIYYDCPGLCNYHLNGVTETLKKMTWIPGREFDIIAVSMNHRENSELALRKKTNYLKEYGRPESAAGWHFLTGTEENIKKLTEQVGFRFHWIESEGQYAHASAAIVVTPKGMISRYLHGILFDPRDMKLALLEASNGKVGNVVDQLLMFCYHFDPAKNKYTLYAFNVMRIGASIFALIMAMVLIPFWLRERKKSGQPLRGES